MTQDTNQTGPDAPQPADAAPNQAQTPHTNPPRTTQAPSTDPKSTGAKPPETATITAAPTPPKKPRSRYIRGLNKDRPMAWLIRAALLTLGSLPIYLYLHADRGMGEEQTRALAVAKETWRTRHSLYEGEVSLESMVPMYQGRPRLTQPPGEIWLYQLAFSRLDPTTAGNEELAAQMRLLSAAFALLVIAAIFWAGFSIGGLKTASFSGLIAASCPALAWFTRTGTAELSLLGCQTLAVASAMWALRPLRPTPAIGRQALGWMICGAALGSAVLIGGLSAMPLVLLPILITAIMCPNRVSHILGLVASICIAGLMVIPWATYVHKQDIGVWELWLMDLWPHQSQHVQDFLQSLYHQSLLIPVLVLPWTLGLIGAFAQPFSASSRGVRRRVFIGWAWLMSVTTLTLLGSGPSGVRGLLALLPPATIMIGQSLRLYSDLSAEGRHTRLWRHVRWMHMTFLLAVSAGLPLAAVSQNSLIEQGILSTHLFAPVPWYFWLGLGVSLTLITLLSMRFALKHYPGKATVCWSIWSVVLISVTLIPLTRGPLMNPQSPAHDTPAPPAVTITTDA